MKSSKYPREIAIRVLTRVLSDQQPLDEALAAVSGEVPSEMRGWLLEVCSGTLRWRGRIDLALDSIALKKKPSGWLRKALMVAAYQLIVQERTSPASVVMETVALIKKKEGQAPSNFANAMLRKIADQAERWKTMTLPPHCKADEGARWASLPEWIWTRIYKQHGGEWAQAFAMASLDRPVVWMRSKQGAEKVAEWATPGPVAESYQVTRGGALVEMPGFEQGEFFVQDISSQTLIAEIAEEIKKDASVKTLNAFDLCAAPGGKSAGLAWSGFTVTSTDRDEARMSLLRQTVARVASQIKVIDRAQVAGLAEQDLVWVDSPCSGSGILRRHPDVRWLRQERELEGLRKVQSQLIEEGFSKVRKGGYFAYSVCSILKEEGPEAIAQASLKGEKIREWFLTPQSAPHGDGFWAVLIRKS